MTPDLCFLGVVSVSVAFSSLGLTFQLEPSREASCQREGANTPPPWTAPVPNSLEE